MKHHKHHLALAIFCLVLVGCDSRNSSLPSSTATPPASPVDTVQGGSGDTSDKPLKANSEGGAGQVSGRNLPRVISVFYFPPDFHRGTDLEMRPKVENITGYDVQFHYQWIINGEENLWEEGAILAGDRFRKGDRLAVEVTPYTIDGEGMPFRSRR